MSLNNTNNTKSSKKEKKVKDQISSPIPNAGLDVLNLNGISSKIDELNLKMHSRFEKLEERLTIKMDKKITRIESLLQQNSEKIFKNAHAIVEINNEMDDIRATIKDLEAEKKQMMIQINQLNAITSTHAVRLQVTEARNENLANRSTRKTLIIKAVPEEGSNESWDETRSIVISH